MSDLIYESRARFSWYITILFGIFIMIFGIDLVISLIESYNILLFIIVSGIYGFGTISILVGVLGVFLVKFFGKKGDLILRWSIIITVGLIPIILFLVIPDLWLISIICAIYLFIFVVFSILDQRSINRSYNPNPEDDLRIVQFIGDLVYIIVGIIIVVGGFAVNNFVLETFPFIYKLGSYGFAFMFTGGIMLLSVIIGYYRRNKGITEKKKIIAQKREEFNAEWFKHQYYDLGRSIQDIADELNESVIRTRKRIDDIDGIENTKDL